MLASIVTLPVVAKQEDTRVAPSLEALRAGDPVEVRRVLEALLPRLRGWLFRLLGPSGDVDDVTQEALIEIARALPRFEGRSSVETFAHRIAVRMAYRAFDTRRRREAPLELVAPPVDLVDLESRVASREALRRLHRCLERLPDKRRVAFVLCAIEGMTPSEAAEIEGSSALAMRSRLLHAREEVARRLGPEATFAPRRDEEDQS